jgi:hypothetical protein
MACVTSASTWLGHDGWRPLGALSPGPRRAGRGRPQLYDGTVALAALARWDRVATADEQTGLSQAVVPHGQWQRRLRVVVVVDLQRQRQAVLCSTEVALPALTRSRDDKARFQIELLGRDAKQCPGLTDGQARSRAKRHCPFKASLTAVSCATLTVQPQTPARGVPFSMACLKRRAFNQHLLARIIEHLAYGGAHPLIF